MRRAARIGETPRTRASEAALSASCSRTIQRLAFIYSIYYFLFCKPTIIVEEFDSDVPVAVDVVNPGAIHLGIQPTTKRRHQLYLRTDSDINVHQERCAAAADFNGLGLGLKSFACGVCSLHVKSKLDRNSRASGSLRRNIATRVFLSHTLPPFSWLGYYRGGAQTVCHRSCYPWLNICRQIPEREGRQDQRPHDHAVNDEDAGRMCPQISQQKPD